MAKTLTFGAIGYVASITLYALFSDGFEKISKILRQSLESPLPISAITLLSVTLLVTIYITKRARTSDTRNYFYAPKKGIILDKREIRKFTGTIALISNDHVFEEIIEESLRTITDTSDVPLWIRISKRVVGTSYLTGEKKQIYYVDILGKKALLQDLLVRLAERLSLYEELKTLKMLKIKPSLDKWSENIVPIKDDVPIPINTKSGKQSFSKLLLGAPIIAVTSALIAYIAKYSLRKKVRSNYIDAATAASIAFSRVESICKRKPTLLSVKDAADKYIVRFSDYEVSVDKRSGEVIRVIKNG